MSAVGLGCWAIGGPFWADGKPIGWGEVDDEESVRAIHRALDLGATFFDTSDVYGAGHSERVLGRALAGRRDEVVIATKFGNTFDETTREITGSDATPEYIRRACQASLQRLATDRIDLYQFHLSEYEPVAAGEVRDVLEELVAEGLIRAYAWSTDDPDRARVFAQGRHCAAVQHELNVLQDAPRMLALCEAEGLASINRSPLAMGLLTGKFSDGSRLPASDIRGDPPQWLKYFRDGHPAPEWLEKLATVREILTGSGRSLAVGALAWILARSDRTIPIPGFRTVAQVEDNLGALARGPLAPDEMSAIAEALA
ncbi:MAG TPA: aldo/keto reductase [Gaiellaceae bacterium]|nr:aldo/keto reductase [Gaiellaceae bacterium]